MKIGWLCYAVVFVLAFASGTVLMVISHRVQGSQQEIAQINLQIADEKEAMRILAAEWSFLNSPERLEKLSAAYLELEPAEPQKLVSNVNIVEERILAEEVVTIESSMIHSAAYAPSSIETVVSSSKPRVGRGNLNLNGRPRQ